MNDEKDSVSRALHDLAAACNDAAEGYAKAAKGVHDRELSNWLTQISGERSRFSADLGKTISRLGGSAGTDLHQGGILHSGWVDLEQRLRSKSDPEILRECLAGDSGTIKHYASALSLGLSSHVRSTVEQQRIAIERDIADIQQKINSGSARKAHV